MSYLECRWNNPLTLHYRSDHCTGLVGVGSKLRHLINGPRNSIICHFELFCEYQLNFCTSMKWITSQQCFLKSNLSQIRLFDDLIWSSLARPFKTICLFTSWVQYQKKGLLGHDQVKASSKKKVFCAITNFVKYLHSFAFGLFSSTSEVMLSC